MRNLWSSAIWMIAFVVIPVLMSCSDNDDKKESGSESALVGTWYYYYEEGYDVYAFHANGTGVCSENTYDSPNDTWTITYAFDAVAKTLVIHEDDEPAEDVDIYQIVELNDSFLILKDSDGDIYKFVKK